MRFTFFVLHIISIHAPRGGSDWSSTTIWEKPPRISIHAPRGGSDCPNCGARMDLEISIHAPRGGSDEDLHRSAHFRSYFNPRSPWGERPVESTLSSILEAFQSTLPVGGATA